MLILSVTNMEIIINQLNFVWRNMIWVYKVKDTR